MRNLEELQAAPNDGTIWARLKSLVRGGKHDPNILRQLGMLSPHLTAEEKAFCGKVEREDC